jgi:hypothetical protein
MKVIALIISALMILLGLTGVFWPEGLMELAKYSFTSTGIYVTAFGRMVIGVLLLLAAPVARTPKTFRVIGAIIFGVGVATAFISSERSQLARDAWLSHGPDAFRIAACLPLAIGLFVGGAVLFKSRTA